jgi:monoamine oxidase
MAAELGPRLHLATRATAIDQGQGRVTVYYDHPSGGGAIDAEYAISAMPFTALRRIEITPPLEPPRREAIAGLRYNQVMKVHLQFKRRFWHDGGGTVGLMSDLPIQTAWDSTWAQPGERGILSVYAADHAALALAALPEPRRWEFCVEQLERLYPGCGAAFETGASVVWHEDPASGGAYSYFAPGELTRFAPWLARPAGRLHFAGEHTDTWQSTMNGALSSGVRAAEEVLRRSEVPSPSARRSPLPTAPAPPS